MELRTEFPGLGVTHLLPAYLSICPSLFLLKVELGTESPGLEVTHLLPVYLSIPSLDL